MAKRILLTGVGSEYGGVETFVQQIVQHLGSNYCFSILAATNKKVARESFFKSRGVEVYYLKDIFGITNAFKRYQIVNEFLASHSFDIIHINSNSLNSAYMAKAAFKNNIKVIYQVHNVAPSGYSKSVQLLTLLSKSHNRKILNHTNTVKVAVSREAALSSFGGENNVDIIVNGIDTAKYCYSDTIRMTVRKKYDSSLESRIGIVVARLTPIKNFKKVISISAKGINNRVFDELWIIGDGLERENIMRSISSLPSEVAAKIRLFGEQENVAPFLIASDFMLLASFSEGLSISVIEAQAAGLPAVLSSGIPKVTNITGNVCYLSINDDDDIWLGCVHKLIGKKVVREQMNKKVERSQFSSIYFIDKIKKLYLI